ncbi:P-loop containing nucleoside triphosphate hydrolase protein [Lentinus brumalis]|uniref:P-loop containing nucleoside triphosphate hydrolase protein n=1 Tax=Lentinus brumalis TaxID=2498619 RepID=A0A371D100_9APHY|nr:P-loop containing nucleoside triphosphate hydrolase protein [Polyporus brumalis]
MPLDLSRLCPDALFGGGCTVPNCPKAKYHSVKFCDLCAAICFSSAAYSSHVGGTNHRRRAAATASAIPDTWIHCPVCDIQVLGPVVWKDHVLGGQHAKRSARQDLAPEDVQFVVPPESQYKSCALCKEAVPIRRWRGHVASPSHTRREGHALLRSTFERSAQNRNGLTISHEESGLDFGVVGLEGAIAGIQAEVSISASTPTSILRVEISCNVGQDASPFSVDVTETIIQPGEVVLVPVSFRHDKRGRFEGRLEIVFQGVGATSTTLMTRSIRGVVGTAVERELLKPVKTYVRRRRAPWHRNRPTVSGERPAAISAMPWVVRLTPALIPSGLAELLKTGHPQEVIAFVRVKYMQPSGTPTKGNHEMFFRALLWIEEARAVEDLHMYDLTDVQIVRDGNLYTLRVDGLAEKRPSVVVGDTIQVQEANAPASGRTYEGFVHTVRLDEIRVSFHKSFNAAGRLFNVCFQLNRVPLRRQHQALSVQTPAHQRLLFPKPTQAGLTQALGPRDFPITPFNDAISANPAQLQGVKSIVNIKPGAAPLNIYGPPGTGKTVLLVESIQQILSRKPSARILVCAPSNSAADIIAQRLTVYTANEMFRCNAASRDPASLPAVLTPYTLYDGDHYALPSKEKLMSYRLTVTTCGNASFAHNIGIPQGHYTHIIVDEAGQASEPEVLTAIKAMAGPNTVVVLAGDPKQLGPVIRSSIAREMGLGKSYLERLLELPLYSGATGRGRSYVKLVKNYRSHDAILRYPNEKFYDDELEVCGPHSQINYFLGSTQLVSPKFPVVFHAISGLNEREASSPSYFNIDEAAQVKVYCQALLQDASYPIRAEDIAVVTQYHGQVMKIRKLLRQAGLEGITVTSVENIQGQERMVVIISTVRSSRDLLSYDSKFTLGFVSNPRRFNVAVTRAQALLIVVGDPTVLSIDPLWRGFMNYIYSHGGWRGSPPSWDVNAAVKTVGDYAEEIQEAAAAEMNAFMDRIEEGDDLEGSANYDRAFQEID